MSTPKKSIIRCPWVGDDELYERYHDDEWGVPVHDDRVLFEFLILEGAQAGLSWSTILKKREGYRSNFADFDPEVVARFDEKRQRQILTDRGIVRNRLKVQAAVENARKFLKVQEEFGSFAGYVWQFVDGKPSQHAFRTIGDYPATTPESDRLSKELKARGFKFVGSTICYAFMQAVGMVNDHTVDCFRHQPVQMLGSKAG